MDIVSHAKDFFPTPFLWPLSDARIDGVPWSEAMAFLPNVLLLALLYAWFFFTRKRRG